MESRTHDPRGHRDLREDDDHNQGKITDAQLVKFLTEEVKYRPGATNPHKSGTVEWWRWSQDGPPDVPGSFREEVVKARDTGLLSPTVFDQVMAVFHRRMK
jgi:hypothetical protein